MKRKVIIDCDPGIDDSLALMLALSSDEIEVVGITIVCGNTPVMMGFENAKKTLAHMHRLDIPIYIGADKPLKKAFCDALDTHGADGLGESFLDEIEGYHQEMDAIVFMSNVFHTQSCSLIALGPLTNLAKLIQQDVEAFHKIEHLVSMGGSYLSHGNCSPVAEYNYWEDPEAAQLVYQHLETSNQLIHMVGLDVTRQIVLTPNILSYMERLNPVEGNFIRQITKFYFDFHWTQEHLIGCVINDPLAVAYFLHPELCSGFASYVQIENDGVSRGQSVVDAHHFYQKDANAMILTQVDVKAFFQYFISAVLHVQPEQIDLLDELI